MVSNKKIINMKGEFLMSKSKTKKIKAVVLFSGGADSHLILRWAIDLKRNPYCVLVDYGQRHIEELDYAKTYLDLNNVPYQVIKISGYDVDSGLTGDGVQGKYNGVSIYNIPARNTIMISIASGIAENVGANEVWIGCDMNDYYEAFPDCKQEYIGKINDVSEIAFSYPMKINAPLLGWTKEMIIEYLNVVYNIQKENMYIGYREFS